MGGMLNLLGSGEPVLPKVAQCFKNGGGVPYRFINLFFKFYFYYHFYLFLYIFELFYFSLLKCTKKKIILVSIQHRFGKD